MEHIEIIVPCYNEQECIIPFFDDLSVTMSSKLSDYSYSVLYIDDGSTDNSLVIMKQLANTNENVKYISLSRNFGKESAIYAGLKSSTGNFVVIMDVDLQDPPYLIPEMLSAISEGYDVASAYRVSREGEPPIRSWFAERFYQLVNSFSEVQIKSGARDFRVMSRLVVDDCISLEEYERFSKGLFQWVGFKTKWIPYKNEARVAGNTKWSFWKLFKYAISGIVSFTTMPLKIASYIGFITVCFSIIYLLYRVLRYGIYISVEIIIVELIIFFNGVVIMLLGIIGEYLARTYLETKRRPIFIIKEKNF